MSQRQARKDRLNRLRRRRALLDAAWSIKINCPALWYSMSNVERMEACRQETIVTLRRQVANDTGLDYVVVPEAEASAIQDIAKRKGKKGQGKILKDERGRVRGELTTEMFAGRYGYYSEHTQLDRAAA